MVSAIPMCSFPASFTPFSPFVTRRQPHLSASRQPRCVRICSSHQLNTPCSKRPIRVSTVCNGTWSSMGVTRLALEPDELAIRPLLGYHPQITPAQPWPVVPDPGGGVVAVRAGWPERSAQFGRPALPGCGFAWAVRNAWTKRVTCSHSGLLARTNVFAPDYPICSFALPK